jgi:hypothetical protein
VSGTLWERRGLFLTPQAPVTIIAPACDGGAVAQLGERLVRNEEVVGSIPIGSTNPPLIPMPLSVTESFAQQAHVSRRLGSPFTALVVGAIAAALDGDGDVAEALRAWRGDPVAGALPLRIAGALHALVLRGVMRSWPHIIRRSPWRTRNDFGTWCGARSNAIARIVWPGSNARHRPTR